MDESKKVPVQILDDGTKIEGRMLEVTCWGMPTRDEIEESKQRIREENPLWVWEWSTYYDTELLMREIIAQAKEEVFFAWGL
jgi:hypothetical protein